ncbi:MAG: phosphoribosylglycinamide formyltransferase [Cyclobacteriaceae bacterium]|nr:MAG: phosphoribosylglycinamide formyltransferase [Cyclobacteriaceae bacterium]
MSFARIAIFISGGGSNAEKIINHFQNHQSIKVVLLLSNNPDAYGLQRAARYNIATLVFNKMQFRESDEIVSVLKAAGVTHIVLAGFLWLIPQNLIEAFPGRIINIHPALLPKFGGKGMYGMRVHEAVHEAGENETGITIHEVNAHYDEGKVLAQQKCRIEKSDSPEQIAAKVQHLEHQYYPMIIEKWITTSL